MAHQTTKKHTVLAIPDLHLPFQHKDTLKFLKAVKTKYKPNAIVFLGDEMDGHAISMHDSDPDGRSAGDELELAKKELKKFYKLFPKAKICTSNHGSLPYRRAYKFGLPKAFLKSYSEFLEAPKGWVWADEHEIDGVIYEHGESFSGQQGAIKSANANMQSTVIGHIHSHAGIQFSANQKHLIFGFNVGCLIDNSAYAFAYGKKFKSKPILGCGIIVAGIPTFIPMLTKNGNWIGSL